MHTGWIQASMFNIWYIEGQVKDMTEADNNALTQKINDLINNVTSPRLANEHCLRSIDSNIEILQEIKGYGVETLYTSESPTAN